MNQLQTTNTRTSNLWKPSPGKQVIRVIPYKHNKDIPFIELFFHYDLGGKTYLSPITYGHPDPIEEFDKLKQSGSRDDFRLGRKLEDKMRTFAPVIVRGEENEGVPFWGFGKTVYQELLSVIGDPDYGDITDPVNGRDISVEFLTEENRCVVIQKLTSESNQIRPTSQKMSQKLESLLENQSDLREIYTELSYDELTDVLNQWLQGTEEEEALKRRRLQKIRH